MGLGNGFDLGCLHIHCIPGLNVALRTSGRSKGHVTDIQDARLVQILLKLLILEARMHLGLAGRRFDAQLAKHRIQLRDGQV